MSNTEPIPTLAYHGKSALDAARWIGDALWHFTLYASPNEAYTAEHLVPAIAEENGAPISSPAEVFPFVLELAAVLADFALSALWDGPPPNEYAERQTRCALQLILGEYSELLDAPVVRLDPSEPVREMRT